LNFISQIQTRHKKQHLFRKDYSTDFQLRINRSDGTVEEAEHFGNEVPKIGFFTRNESIDGMV